MIKVNIFVSEGNGKGLVETIIVKDMAEARSYANKYYGLSSSLQEVTPLKLSPQEITKAISRETEIREIIRILLSNISNYNNIQDIIKRIKILLPGFKFKKENKIGITGE